MHRIDGPGATVDNKFTDGDPVGGIQATLVTDDWLTDIQENVMAVVEAGPITPTKGRAADLLDAIRKIISAQAGHGQCRLKFVNATTLRLDPQDGRNLIIQGVPRQIPVAGVTLSNGGLSANTTYYIYAFMNGTTMTLEASVTGHSQDATTGVEIKTGDATRTLVGGIRANASSQFADTPATRHVASYYNRSTRNGGVFNSAGLAYTNTLPAEISAALRVTFFTWGDEVVPIKATGQYIIGVNQSVTVEVRVDGAVYGDDSANFENTSITGMTFSSIGNALLPGQTLLSEGFHTSSPYGTVTGTTGTVTRINHTLELRI